jgi:hypothetical protein
MVADLMWVQDQERAKRLFRDLWIWINKQDEVDFKKEESRVTLLVRLFKRDSKLARELIAAEFDSNVSEKQVIKMASELVELQPTAAGELLDQAISKAPTIEALNVLARLQSKDVRAADGVALSLLRGLGTQPASVAIPIIYSLNYYVFPLTKSGEASPRTNWVIRRQYFLSAYDVLMRSLPEQPPTPDSSQLRKRFQLAQLAHMLALLSKEYAPLRQIELQNLALQLSTDMPADIRQITKALLQRIDGSTKESEGNYQSSNEKISPAQEILRALAQNDFDEAKWILDRMDEGPAKTSSQRAIKMSEFRFLCSKGQMSKALSVAVTYDDPERKVSMFSELGALIYAKASSPDWNVAREFRLAFRSLEKTQSTALVAYSLAALASRHSTVDSFDWLRYGNSCVNSFDTSKLVFGRQELLAFEQSFAEVGRGNLEEVIAEANGITDPTLKQMARLAACESWLKLEINQPGTARKSVQ